MTQTPEITYKSWIMIATLGFVWGGTFLVTEIALTGMSPFWVAAARVVFAALLMTLVWARMGFRLFDTPSATPKAQLVFIGLGSSTIPFALLAWGQQHVTAGFAGVSMASIALMVLPLAHLFLPGERMTLRRTLGFVIGFLGVVVLIGGKAFDNAATGFETHGRIACLAATACYAVCSIALRRLPPVDPVGLASILLIIGAVGSVPMALAVEGLPPVPSAQTLGVLLFLGLIPTAMANLLRILVIRSAGPVFMSLVNYQVPLWSILLGAWILSEPLPPSLLSGMMMILFGVCLSQLGALRRLFSR